MAANREPTVNRNAKWMTEGYDGDLAYSTNNIGLGNYLSTYRTFVAIAAGNLHGPNGIKHLLENQGFVFEEVPWLEHANNVGPIQTAAHP